jgi:hypothetical protein
VILGTFAVFSQRHINMMFDVRDKYFEKYAQVHTWFRHQDSQLGNGVYRLENNICVSIAVWRLELL